MIADDNNPIPIPIPPESFLEPPASPSTGLRRGPEIPAAATLPSPVQPDAPPPELQQYPEDLRARWGWLDLLLLVAVALLGTFVISIILVGIFAAFGMTPASLQNSANNKSLFLIVNQAILSLGLLAYLAVHIRARCQSPFWKTIGWRRLRTGTIPRRIAYIGLVLGGFSLSLLVQLASAALQTKTKLPIQEYFQDPRSALLLMLMSILLAPLVEETVFRGYLYPVLARSFGIGAGVVITGTLFGLLHAPQLWGGWGQILLLIGIGIVFTAARAISRTVIASYILHVSYNSFLLIAFLVASHGFRHFPPGPQ
ncbi:MAG TPA: type II CAAX endopeptidase family protein [Candidatus Acidoferrales bacterium]|nr:type II CAAX endopeptidase family protein [Candidatus Acidoferrales bacterium]